MRAFDWTVLTLLFVVEVLCAVAAGFIGAHYLGPVGAALGPLLVITVWALFASPKARYGTPTRRFIVTTVVFVGSGIGLIALGHLPLGIGLIGVSGVVAGLSRLPEVRSLIDESPGQAA